MKRTIRLLFCLAAVVTAGFTVNAQYYTIAPGGPSGYSPNSVYTPGFPPPTIGPGATLFLAGPPPPLLIPGSVVDALSSGADAGSYYLYSSMAGAVGLPASPVFVQTTVGTGPSHVFGPGAPLGPTPPEAAGDVFAVGGPGFGILALAPAVAFAPVPTDEFFLGLNVGPLVPDDLNSLTYRAPIPGAFYYSLAPVAGASPGSIYRPAGVYAPALALSLDTFGPNTDDIDAILVQDLGVIGVYEPLIDFVAFSLSPGSATLAAVGPGYALGGGDLLVRDGPDADALPDIFIPGAAFGLAPGDNLDAIDVVPEPSVVSLVLAGFGLLGLRFRRTRRVA